METIFIILIVICVLCLLANLFRVNSSIKILLKNGQADGSKITVHFKGGEERQGHVTEVHNKHFVLTDDSGNRLAIPFSSCKWICTVKKE